MIEHFSKFPILICFFIACISIRLVVSAKSIQKTPREFYTLDSLRGVLALSVYIHHSLVWYCFLKSHSWANPLPNSNFYVQLGQSAVSLFFMITSFLFTKKIIREQIKSTSLSQFYITRFFRIYPLYIFINIFVFNLVLFQTSFNLKVSSGQFALEILKFLFCGLFGFTTINGFLPTLSVYAGVFWTLAYEWVFYLLVPLGVCLRSKKINLFIILPILLIPWFFYFWGILNFYCFVSFAFGIVAALLSENKMFRDYLRKPIFSLVVILILLINMVFIKNSYNLYSQLILFIIFTIISSGNDFWGMLRNRYLIYLGEISYGIYLLHGLILFIAIRYFFGFGESFLNNPDDIFIYLYCLTPFLIFFSYLLHKVIEVPLINLGKKVNR